MTETRRGIQALRLYYVAAVSISGVYLPFFPRWLQARGMLGLRMGVIAAAAPAMSVLAPTAFGAAADALKLRGGLLQLACGGALLTFGTVAIAAAVGWPLGFWSLLLAAIVFALFRSPMGLVADIVALELAPAAGTTYGRLRLWGSLGFMVVLPLATRYVDPLDATAFPVAVCGLVAAALLASLRLPRHADLPARSARRGVGQLLAERDFGLFLVAVFLGQGGHVAYDLCFSLRLFELGVSRPTFWLAWDLGTGAEVLLMAYSAWLFRAFSPATLLACALGAATLRWCSLALVRSSGVLLLLQPLHALSFGLSWLASLGYTSRRFPADSLGTAQGLFATALGAGSVVGMVTWASVYQRVGGAAVFAGAACFSACGCAFAIALQRRMHAAPCRVTIAPQ